MSTEDCTQPERKDLPGALIAGLIAGAGIASLALILATRASRAQGGQSLDSLLSRCDGAAEALEGRISKPTA